MKGRGAKPLRSKPRPEGLGAGANRDAPGEGIELRCLRLELIEFFISNTSYGLGASD